MDLKENLDKHTPEPWAFSQIMGYGASFEICGQAGEIITRVMNQVTKGQTEENARRIVACVNACKGIENATLERAEQPFYLKEFIGELEERDEALAEDLGVITAEVEEMREDWDGLILLIANLEMSAASEAKERELERQINGAGFNRTLRERDEARAMVNAMISELDKISAFAMTSTIVPGTEIMAMCERAKAEALS